MIKVSVGDIIILGSNIVKSPTVSGSEKMATKVKGLFRGLKHLSQIFDEKAEDEIQIGFPTDVKHVAHIGMDGPSATTPTWMNEFKTAPQVSQPAPAKAVETQGDSKTSKGSKQKAKLPKHISKSRHSSLESNSTDSPARASSDGSKHVRRHRSSDPSSECSVRDSTSSGSRHSRKARSSNPGSDSPASSKHGRRRKAEGPERSSRRSSKGDSMTDISSPDLDA